MELQGETGTALGIRDMSVCNLKAGRGWNSRVAGDRASRRQAFFLCLIALLARSESRRLL